jgi:hypothetical protein
MRKKLQISLAVEDTQMLGRGVDRGRNRAREAERPRYKKWAAGELCWKMTGADSDSAGLAGGRASFF